MTVCIYYCDEDGNPVKGTGEFFSGDSALGVIEALKNNPFQMHLTAHEYMQNILAGIDAQGVELPENPEQAAMVFLQTLASQGYAEIKNFAECK